MKRLLFGAVLTCSTDRATPLTLLLCGSNCDRKEKLQPEPPESHPLELEHHCCLTVTLHYQLFARNAGLHFSLIETHICLPTVLPSIASTVR